MLFQQALKNLGRINASSPLLKHPFRQINHLTPISSYQNFHRNRDGRFRETGLMNGIDHNILENPFTNQRNLPRAIHSCSVLYFKYSNLLEQKGNENVSKKIAGVDKLDDAVKPTLQNVDSILEETKALGLFARFKKMAKDYWYVLIPVHVATSCFWLGSFYYASKR
jgi:Protein of unknown function (DUF1279)